MTSERPLVLNIEDLIAEIFGSQVKKILLIKMVAFRFTCKQQQNADHQSLFQNIRKYKNKTHIQKMNLISLELQSKVFQNIFKKKRNFENCGGVLLERNICQGNQMQVMLVFHIKDIDDEELHQ